MNKFVLSLLATMAYTKHNLAIWKSEADLGFFSSGGLSCGTDYSDCSYYGYNFLAAEASIAGGLDNYWNDGSA